jgi:hypothetical protein
VDETSLNRPGGNATGFVELNTDIASKQLGLLHDLLPRASRFGLLVEVDSPGMSVITGLQAEASAIGLQVEALITGGTTRAIDGAFASLAQRQIDALICSAGSRLHALRAELAVLAKKHAVPAIYWDRVFIEADGADELRIKRRGHVSPGRRLCRPHSQRRKAGRPAGDTSHQVRVGHQSVRRITNLIVGTMGCGQIDEDVGTA